MNLTKRNLLFLAVAALTSASAVLAQKVSPAATAQIDLSGNTIAIKYSRPYMHGRKIVGGLVPYGQVLENRSRRRNVVQNSGRP